MKLHAYLHTFPRKVRGQKVRELAIKLGISAIYIRSMSNGNKRILEKWALPIEKATDGQVTRKDCCPSLYE